MSITAMMQPQTQMPQLAGQQSLGQLDQIYGAQLRNQPTQLPHLMGAQPYGQMATQQSPLGALGVQVVSDTVLRVVAAALTTVLEQLRIDPLAQQSLCAQGQLSAQAYSNVITEAARRSAPIVTSAIAQITAGIQAQAAGQLQHQTSIGGLSTGQQAQLPLHIQPQFQSQVPPQQFPSQFPTAW
jgi:hypothetical protein